MVPSFGKLVRKKKEKKTGRGEDKLTGQIPHFSQKKKLKYKEKKPKKVAGEKLKTVPCRKEEYRGKREGVLITVRAEVRKARGTKRKKGSECPPCLERGTKKNVVDLKSVKNGTNKRASMP